MSEPLQIPTQEPSVHRTHCHANLKCEARRRSHAGGSSCARWIKVGAENFGSKDDLGHADRLRRFQPLPAASSIPGHMTRALPTFVLPYAGKPSPSTST
jgi:hypothetical protein